MSKYKVEIITTKTSTRNLIVAAEDDEDAWNKAEEHCKDSWDDEYEFQTEEVSTVEEVYEHK